MDLEVELNIKASDFFAVITDSVKQDVGEETPVFKGLAYEKKIPAVLSGSATANVTITEFIENKIYSVEYKTSRSTINTTYRIEEVLDKIKVFYEEIEEFDSKMDKLNANFMKMFYEKRKRNQLRSKLKSLENYAF